MNLNMGLLGCGTVGAGVIELTRRRSEKILGMTGLRPVIKRVLVQDLSKPREVDVDKTILTKDASEILSDPDISVIIETIGGIEPARSYILRALEAGKHVVTANKDLIALHGSEILETARKSRVNVLYEAAVGGAIPLVRPLKEYLAANDISDLKGIINGTTNYILSKMTETGAEFSEALAEAQALGYVEADPSSDLDGLDAARKLAILGSIAFRTPVRLDEVQVQGIRTISAADVAYANEIGTVIKLLATGRDRNGTLTLQVVPTLIPKQHPLASVSDSYNALFIRGDAAGDLMFFGRGAGSLPTASAIIGDVIEVLRNIKLGVSDGLVHEVLPGKRVDPLQGEIARYYMRLTVEDMPGVFARIASVFAEAGVSMETVLQKRALDNQAEIVIVTHQASPRQLEGVINGLAKLPSTNRIENVLPVESIPES